MYTTPKLCETHEQTFHFVLFTALDLHELLITLSLKKACRVQDC